MSLAGASSRLPLVSIVMPAWNAQATLAEAIASVQVQTLADWELLVVVDAATDDTLAIAQAHAESDARIRVLVNPVNRGVAETRNRALAEVRGEYVAFLDSDDRWHADKLAQQYASLQATGCAISYTAYQRFGADGVLNRVTPVLRVTFHDLLRGNVIGLSTGMLRAGLARQLRFASIGHEDYLFWLQAVQRAGEARRVPGEQPLADYRVQAGSRSANIWRNAGWQWHIYRHHLGLSWPTAAGLMGHYAARAWAKRRAS